MNNFIVLLKGELQRMKKYNIVAASFLTVLIWIGVLQFSGQKDVTHLFPIFIFVDATTMSMLMIGVTMFFEKQEGVLKSLFVSPINKNQYILAKTFANISSNLFTLIVLYIYSILVKEIHVNILGLIGAVVLIAIFHSLIGFILTYYSKDFTNMLIAMMKYIFVLGVPVLLEQLSIIKSDIISKLLYFVPTKASMNLLQVASNTTLKSWEVVISLAYMIIASILIFIFVSKRFDKFAIKESGV
ncbi:ABC transporter permease [Mycoplasmatota bacterium]|nr:ABC transporter permease [Mycoplasmatota bacterium]